GDHDAGDMNAGQEQHAGRENQRGHRADMEKSDDWRMTVAHRPPHGSRISGSPMRMVAPSRTLSHIPTSGGADTMMVEPCSNQPISSPLATGALQGRTLGPRYFRLSSASRQCRRMLATRTAATGTSTRQWPASAIFSRSTARSFLQNSFSMRRSAIGFTFQASPET